MERFHAAFNQDEKGEKRKNISTDEGHITKRVKSGLKALGQDEDSEDGDEMYGRGRRYHDIESDEDMDSNYDSEDNDGDEDNEEYDRQSNSEDNDEDDDKDLDEDDEDGEDIKYMQGFGDIKIVGDKIYEQVDSKMDLDNGDIEIDGDIYKLNGGVYMRGRHKLYLLNGMLFEECEDSNIDMGTDEIMNWDGKCFKRVRLGWEEKLESAVYKLEDNLELE